MNSGAVTWTRRREIAKSLRDLLRDERHTAAALRILQVLADDPKWEVRKEVAGLLINLSDAEFAPLAAKLSEDQNSFVRTAAERCLNRRRREPRNLRSRQKGLGSLLEDFDLLERMHGSQVAIKAQRMALRLYEELVGSTAHELRGVLTPLGLKVSAARERLERSEFDAAHLSDSLNELAERLALLSRFVDDMRTFSQPMPTERIPTPLEGVVSEAHRIVLDDLRATGRNPKAVEASLSVAALITVAMARHQVVSAIVNVLKNAYEALPVNEGGYPSGTITLRAELADGRGDVRIVVEDNGAGINSDDLRELQAFVPGRTTKRGYGTGFGLPIARRCIEAHGGTIQIESEESRGTKVTFTIPIEAAQDAEE